jgi:hypothetical protein
VSANQCEVQCLHLVSVVAVPYYQASLLATDKVLDSGVCIMRIYMSLVGFENERKPHYSETQKKIVM